MHYGDDAFTKKELLDDDRNTLTAKKDGNLQFGQRADFSKVNSSLSN